MPKNKCPNCGNLKDSEYPLCFDCNRKEKSRLTTKSHYYNKPKSTPQTIKLGNLLKEKGYKVEFEKYDGFKHIDIAIVKSKVNIEVDGNHHHGKDQALKDLKRTFYSWNKDFVTLRIPNALTEDDKTLKETADYIDRFLKKGRTKQLEKEIEQEYIDEGNLFWKDATNFVNGVNNIIDNFGNAVNNISNTFSKALKKF